MTDELIPYFLNKQFFILNICTCNANVVFLQK